MRKTAFSMVLSAAAIVAGAAAWSPTTAYAGVAEVQAAERINVAGLQRSLIQKMIRDTCFVMSGLAGEEKALDVATVAQEFETVLNGLTDGVAARGLSPEENPKVREKLEDVSDLWGTLGPAVRQVAAGDLHTVPMGQIIELSPQIAQAMNTAVGEMANQVDGQRAFAQTGRTLDLAGRQRMLSFKVAKEVCFVTRDIDARKNRTMALETMAQFEQALNDLRNGAPQRGITALSGDALERLADVEKTWAELNPLLGKLQRAGVAAKQDDKLEMARLTDQLRAQSHALVLAYID